MAGWPRELPLTVADADERDVHGPAVVVEVSLAHVQVGRGSRFSVPMMRSRAAAF
jgi:hypothetical protein